MKLTQVGALLGLLAAAFSGILPAAHGEEEGYRPIVGQVHPDVTLPNIETRQAVSLAQYRGKKVLLIHFASW